MLMNAVELLKDQHSQADRLFARFERARRADEQKKIFEELAPLLVAHDAMEREVFYPACERIMGEDEKLMEGIAEHGLVEFCTFRADQARGKDTFAFLVKILREVWDNHVDEEESEILPRVVGQMEEVQLERLGARMLERFEASQERDFRAALQKNLQEVLAGRVKTTPARPKATAKRTARVGGTRRTPKVRTKRTTRGRAQR
jgi:hemerythrin superfamily protein